MNRINILEYLEASVMEVPEKIAFSTGTESRTFREVHENARRIGSAVLSYGCRKEPVVVLMEKHPDTVTAFLGVIAARCFYVCLDSSMPLSRMALIMEKLRPRLLISDRRNEKTAAALSENAATPLTVLHIADALAAEENTEALMRAREEALDTDPIYVVFTSGSTGVPKGVIACHRSVIDYTENLSDALGFSRDTIYANQSPLFFDAPLKELMPTLKFGATTYFVPKMLFMFPVRLIEYLNTYRVNTVCWVVSALVQISQLGALSVIPSQWKVWERRLFHPSLYCLWDRIFR
ncbi:MAG: AMP-binding protein, partial [Clostridia bacterium]|nr:AMP-binding protein [Clostridia bacterium]